MKDQIKRLYKSMLKKVLYTDKTLTPSELSKLNSLLKENKEKNDDLNYEIMQ